jgi:hypothetical protein
MSQPKWKCIANLGDASTLDYGGLFVYIDETGEYPPEMENLYEPDESNRRQPYEVHRVVLERCTYINGVLSDNSYHPECAAWFADDIESVALSMGCDPDDIRDWLCCDDPLRLAEAYRCIYDYHGWLNGDEYPLHLSRKEAEERYAEVIR